MNPEVPITSGSKTGNQKTDPYGDLMNGNGNVLCSCPLNREVVHGAETYLKWLPTHRTVSTMVSPGIWISNYRGVTLCVCNVPEQSFRGRCCALDAEGKVITVLMEKFVGIVNPKKCGNESCTCGTNESGIVLPPEENDTSSIILKK